MANNPTAKQQVQEMLDRGWAWRDAYSDVLVHPQDHAMFATYDRTADTLTLSPALVKALTLVIPTPAGQNPRYWRDEQKAKPRRKSG